jgi:hypothetical protein
MLKFILVTFSMFYRSKVYLYGSGPRFFWLDTIRSIRIDSRLEIDTIFRYVASALPRFRYATRSMAYILHTY